MNHLIAYYGTRLKMAEELGIPYYKLNSILNEEPRKLVEYFPLISKQIKMTYSQLWDLIGREIELSELPKKVVRIHEFSPEIMKLMGIGIDELMEKYRNYGV